MPICEFAYVQLPSDVNSSTPALLKNLVEVKTVIESESHDTTSFFRDLNDEHRMYVVGGWPSQSAHQHGFDGSAKQAQIIDLIKDQMNIKWMNYFDVPYSQIPGKGAGKLLCAVVLTFKGFLHSKRQRDEINRHLQGSMEADRITVESWNLKKASSEEDDVLVLWSEWADSDAEGAERWARGVGEMLATAAEFKNSDVRLMKLVEL